MASAKVVLWNRNLLKDSHVPEIVETLWTNKENPTIVWLQKNSGQNIFKLIFRSLRACETRNVTHELSHESAHEYAHGGVHENVGVRGMPLCGCAAGPDENVHRHAHEG